MPAVNVSAPSAKKSVKPGGSHGRWRATRPDSANVLVGRAGLEVPGEGGRDVALQHPRHRSEQLAKQWPGDERVRDRGCDANLVVVARFPASRPPKLTFEVLEPRPALLVHELQEDGFATVEVAQHIGLRQPDPVGQFPQTDLADALLGQHRSGDVQDRRTPSRHLFGSARPLKAGPHR